MKIIYYMPIFLKSQTNNSSNKKLHDFCELFKMVSPNASLIDRCNSFETPFDIKILYDIPQRPVENITFTYDDVCISRASEILQENKNVIIFYSGGLDSTVVLLSFWLAIKNGIGSFDQVTVAASQHSIIENPIFWNKIIIPYFKLSPVNEILENISLTNRYVMGENADQLFGGGLLYNLFDIFHKEINNDNIEELLTIRKINPSSREYIHNALTNLVLNASVELKLMSDLLWWINFSAKWQSVALRTLCFTNFLDIIENESDLKFFDTFFNTQDFQILSLYGNLPKWGDTPSLYNYKLASRLFIEKYVDIGNYTKIKIKVPSLYRVLTTGSYKYNALGVENGKIYRVNEIKCQY